MKQQALRVSCHSGAVNRRKGGRLDDELLMARDPDGGLGQCLPVPGEPAPGKMDLKLDHIAVVVKDLDRAVRLFGALGYVEERRLFLQGVQNVVMTISGGASIVVQSPVSRLSELVDFLADHGAGVQHVGFETASLEQTQKLLDGVLTWEREPDVHPGLRVLTSKPDSATGLVFEIVERSPEEKVRLFREAGKRRL